MTSWTLLILSNEIERIIVPKKDNFVANQKIGCW